MAHNTASNRASVRERSITGVVVHLLALIPFGLLVVALAYAIGSKEFTTANARNVLNWHLTLLAIYIVGVPSFVLGADELEAGGETVELGLLPAPLDTVALAIGVVLVVVGAIGTLLTLLFALIATVKAIFGTAWEYPFAPSILG